MNDTQESIVFWLAVMSHEHKPYWKEQLEGSFDLYDRFSETLPPQSQSLEMKPHERI